MSATSNGFGKRGHVALAQSASPYHSAPSGGLLGSNSDTLKWVAGALIALVLLVLIFAATVGRDSDGRVVLGSGGSFAGGLIGGMLGYQLGKQAGAAAAAQNAARSMPATAPTSPAAQSTTMQRSGFGSTGSSSSGSSSGHSAGG